MSSKQQARARFDALVWPQAPALLRVAQILCGGNVPEAEDLVQETMLKAFRAIDSFQDGTDVRAWLMTILRNTRIDRVRSRQAAGMQVSLEHVGDVAATEEAGTGEWYQLGENPEVILQEFSDRQVIEAIKTLPEEIRWTLLLVDVEGMDHKEAAEVLDVPVGTIKSRAHRGRGMLREALLPVAKQMRVIR